VTSTSRTFSESQAQPVRRWLQINVCAMCCLAAVIFAAAEGSPLALLTVPVAIGGLLFVDRGPFRGLSPLWANVLGLAAFCAAGAEFFSSIEGRLLGFAHLLVYFTWILALQHKEAAQFWWLCALSVLQVATASVLTTDVWFPLGAITYMLLALWTLSVFSIDRAVNHSLRVVEAAVQTGRVPGAAERSRSRGNVRAESAARWLTPPFVAGVLINGALSLLLGLGIFVLTPRIWAGGLRFFGDEGTEANQPLTGFTDEVRLGDMGEILENPSLVLEVQFRNYQTGEALGVEQTMAQQGYDVPLFRGRVLGRYSSGRWSPPALLAAVPRTRTPRNVPLIRQQIRLHPIGTRTLFTAGRAVDCRTEQRVIVEHELLNNTFELESGRRSQRALERVFEYDAFSSLIGETLSPPGLGLNLWRLNANYQQTMLLVPQRLTRLKELTRQLIRTSDGTILSEAQIADVLVRHLRDSGEYGYTMRVSVDDPTIDPVEDFLFNRKQGHCEYFASALALMLRSANIPARLVSGFKGGALNESSGLYEVRQLHAHAWVEAMIDREWVVLDATPAARDASVAGISTATSSLAAARQRLQAWWSQGLTLDQSQQRRMIYEPLQTLFAGWVQRVRHVGLLESAVGWLKELSSDPREWISIAGFFTAFALLLLLSGSVWLVQRLWNLLGSTTLRGGRRHRQQRQLVAFYERFRLLVSRQGHVRESEMTQHEFAAQIERDWSGRPDVDGLANLPTRLTEAFYRVRFGHLHLSPQELQQIESSLVRLEGWVRRAKN
jgi:protein-glutamine gamma-glutamyltransferase